jgi:hypothetical protein
MEVRAQAIAVFFAQGFGSFGSHLYGHLIGNGHDPNKLYVGYLIGAGAMIAGGLAEVFLGVAAEGKSLEDVASPPVHDPQSRRHHPQRPGQHPRRYRASRVNPAPRRDRGERLRL